MRGRRDTHHAKKGVQRQVQPPGQAGHHELAIERNVHQAVGVEFGR
jgi:hypothetical protein